MPILSKMPGGNETKLTELELLKKASTETAARAHTQTMATKQEGQACPSLDRWGAGKEGLDCSLAFKTKQAISERANTLIPPQGPL